MVSLLKRTTVTFVTIILVINCAYKPKIYSINDQKKDLKILKRILLKNTGNPYKHTDCIPFESQFDTPDEYIHEPLKFNNSNDPYIQAVLNWIKTI